MNTALNGWPEFRPYVYRGTGEDTLTAWMDDGRTTYNGPSPGKILKPCGTLAAYRRHLRRGEYPCVQCTEANLIDWHARKGAAA